MIFRDRAEAGKKLAEALSGLRGAGVVVLGIPRGGVVVADQVAAALDAPLDVVVTKKIEAPGEPEYALGAVTQDGEIIMDEESAESLGASPEYLAEQVRLKKEEVKERLERLRGNSPYPQLEGKVVVVVDDGIATGSSVAAAVMSVKKRKPKEIVVAVPVAPSDAVQSLAEGGTKVVCLQTPGPFLAIGEFYERFDQVEDLEVKRLLDAGRTRRGSESTGRS